MHALPQGFHRIRQYGLLTMPPQTATSYPNRCHQSRQRQGFDKLKAEEPKAPEHPSDTGGLLRLPPGPEARDDEAALERLSRRHQGLDLQSRGTPATANYPGLDAGARDIQVFQEVCVAIGPRSRRDPTYQRAALAARAFVPRRRVRSLALP